MGFSAELININAISQVPESTENNPLVHVVNWFPLPISRLNDELPPINCGPWPAAA